MKRKCRFSPICTSQQSLRHRGMSQRKIKVWYWKIIKQKFVWLWWIRQRASRGDLRAEQSYGRSVVGAAWVSHPVQRGPSYKSLYLELELIMRTRGNRTSWKISGVWISVQRFLITSKSVFRWCTFPGLVPTPRILHYSKFSRSAATTHGRRRWPWSVLAARAEEVSERGGDWNQAAPSRNRSSGTGGMKKALGPRSGS